MIDTSSLDPAMRSDSGRSSGHRLLIPIVVGIVCGTAVGGLVPALGVRTAILGEIFLNLFPRGVELAAVENHRLAVGSISYHHQRVGR